MLQTLDMNFLCFPNTNVFTPSSVPCGVPHESTFASILDVRVGVRFVVFMFGVIEHGDSSLGPLGPLAIICAYINNL